jgi:putative transposase
MGWGSHPCPRSLTVLDEPDKPKTMPRGLRRYQDTGDLHFVTFSCYQRRPYLAEPEFRFFVERALEEVRRWYGLFIGGYVIMPEHVHLLATEPERGTLALALQMLKQNTARSLGSDTPFWTTRYYDFNVWSEKKRIEKLKYIHRNPVRRGLVKRPEDWPWSSFLHYATGIEGLVEIESHWTARRRNLGTPSLSVMPLDR